VINTMADGRQENPARPAITAGHTLSDKPQS
jgi:hypothetical protein